MDNIEDDDDFFSQSPLLASPIDKTSSATHEYEICSPGISKPGDQNAKVTSLEHLTDDIIGDVSCEFLLTAIHQILYLRGIYPKEIFRPYKKYHLTVHMSVYPKLTDYISDVLKPLPALIAKREVRSVVLSILQNDKVFEQFVFELLSENFRPQKSEKDHFVDLEISLRECLLRIAAYDGPLPEDPEKCSFEILFQVNRSSALQMLFDDESKMQWIKHEENHIASSEKKLHPLKTVKDSPYLRLQMYVLKDHSNNN